MDWVSVPRRIPLSVQERRRRIDKARNGDMMRISRWRCRIDTSMPMVAEGEDLKLFQDPESRFETFGKSLVVILSLSTSIRYAVTQLGKFEDSIHERWTKKQPETFITRRSMSMKSKSFVSRQQNAFDGSRKEMNAAIDRICEFTGIKIIFWDLREPFIDNLYKHSVSESRLEVIIEPLDEVLNELCSVIVEPLRDRIVTGLLQASVDALVRVILDGGPSRVYLPSDAKLLEEDLEILKEFFISGGDGLPRGMVENLIARVRPILNLQSFETRVLIDDLKVVSQGGKSQFGAESQTLLRILCHRTDSEASQYLKKQFKIPKSVS